MIAIGLVEHMRCILNAYRAIKVSNTEEIIKKECYYKVIAAQDRRTRIIDNLFGIEVPP
jgi:hypothetical protein